MEKSALKIISGFLEGLAGSQDPGWRHFSKVLQGEIGIFDRLGKVANLRGAIGLEEFFREERSPFEVGGADVYGGGQDRWYFYFWGCLFPEKFVPNRKNGYGEPGYVLKEGESLGDRERIIILSLLTSPSGRTLLFEKVMEQVRARFGNRPPWPQDVLDGIEDLMGRLSICPRCGTLFLGGRKGVKYCGPVCRKRDHDVPSSNRKDQTPRMYFYRKVAIEGVSREDAWDQTKKQHGAVLKELGKDGPEPPKSWAKKTMEGRD